MDAVELAELVEKLKDGDIVALGQLQEHLIPTATKAARKLGRAFPRKKDDILSVSFLGMCEFLNRIMIGRIRNAPNIEACTYLACKWKIFEFVRSDKTISKIKGHVDVLSLNYTGSDDTEMEDIDEPEDKSVTLTNLDFEDFFKNARAKTNTDRSILLLSYEGHTYDEIAEILSIKKRAIRYRMFLMQKHYRKALANGKTGVPPVSSNVQ